MAVTTLTGFEGAAGSLEPNSGTVSGTASYDTGTVRTGARSVRCNPASGATGNFSMAAPTGNSKFIHFALQIASMPSVARSIYGNVDINCNLRLNTDGTLSYKSAASVIGTTTTALSTGIWYWIGFRVLTGTSVVLIQIDGVDALTGTTSNSLSSCVFGLSGTEASAIDLFVDDVIIDDAGFLAPSKVDIALPISDNTVTGVTDNNGVTTNIFDCVDNTPPAGVASANEAANAKAGMHFPASTTCNYLANLETYTTLGIAAADTVLAVQSLVRHGEDIATGTKNLQNVGALTNPTVAGASVTAGGDAGAHGVETGNWTTTFGTLTTSPSVTLGTSPTVRTSRTSESRLACLDFMGMNVAWTPAAVTSLLIPHRHRGLIVR